MYLLHENDSPSFTVYHARKVRSALRSKQGMTEWLTLRENIDHSFALKIQSEPNR